MVSGVKRSGVFIGVGVAVGLGLVVYGANRLGAPKSRHAAPVERMQVVAAGRPVARGDRIQAADLVMVDMPGPIPPGAVTAEGPLVGRTAAVEIPVHQLLNSAALVPLSEGLAAQVPVGYRAISIQTNDEIAVSNLLRPGDVVDVELVLGDAVLSKGFAGAANDRSESDTLLQAVRVVSVGDMIGPGTHAGDNNHGGEAREPRRTLTLAMTPEQVAQFTLARSLGAFYLALRNPDDSQGAPRALARLPDLRVAGAGPVASKPALAARTTRTTRVARNTASEGVELVVGGQHQTIYAQ